MINKNEKQFFDKLYKYVHEHINEKYDIYFDENTNQKAVFETDYETDNGLEIEDKKYEEYCEILFKPYDGEGFITVNYHTLPYKIVCGTNIVYEKNNSNN